MKISVLIATVSATALLAAGCGRQQPQQQAFCVDRAGNAINPDYCDDDDGRSGGGAFIYMPYGAYKNKYPSRYKSAVKSYRSSGYASRSYSGTSRSISGSSARSFSSGSIGG